MFCGDAVVFLQYSRQTPFKALIMMADTSQSVKHTCFCILRHLLLWEHTFFDIFFQLYFSLQDCLSLFAHVSVHLSNVAASNVLLFSPLSWCLCSQRNWRTFWRSVTWFSQACSVWRCCWSSWLWGSLATSKTPIMASTASLSSSGELLLPSAPQIIFRKLPQACWYCQINFKNALTVL